MFKARKGRKIEEQKTRKIKNKDKIGKKKISSFLLNKKLKEKDVGEGKKKKLVGLKYN